MSALFEAGRRLQSFLESRDWRFCFIGGLAVLRWGEPRFTRDVDVSLLCPFGLEDKVSMPMLEAGYRGRVSDVPGFARQTRVVLLEDSAGVPVDIALAALPFEEGVIERSNPFEFEAGTILRTCSAEDLVVMKLFAFRARDISDAEGVVMRQRGNLDWRYIETNLRPLAEVKEQPEIMAALQRLRGRR